MTGVLPIVVINELCLRAGSGLTAFSDGSFVAVSSAPVTMVLRSSMVTIEALRSMLVTGRVRMAGKRYPTPSVPGGRASREARSWRQTLGEDI